MAHPGGDYSKLKRILEEIVKLAISADNKCDLKIHELKLWLIRHLVENYLLKSSDMRFPDNSDTSNERMRQVLSYIQNNYNKPITLKELANQLYLTDAYLSRFLKKTLNMNFSAYLNKVRIHYAVEELLSSSKSVTRIAMDNGFSNITTFNKAFREYYHTTPSKYKAEMQLKQAANDEKARMVKSRLRENIHQYFSEARDTENRPLKIVANAKECKPYQPPWNVLFNVGEMHSLRDYRIRVNIQSLKANLKFTHVRFFNILSDKMLIGQYISDVVQDYNFSYVDDCIDFLLQNQLKPFLQMGYKPMRFGDTRTSADGKIEIAPLFSFPSLSDLCKTLKIVLEHLIQRYGSDEIGSWNFEIWHPKEYYQLPADWYGEDNTELYSIRVYHVIRSMLPEVKIGGAEYAIIADKEYIRKQMRRYKDAGVAFDFITYVSYPYQVARMGDQYVRKWLSDEKYMRNEIHALREIMNEFGDGAKPLWMSEYNLTISHRNILNDTSFKGAYILKNMFDVVEETSIAGYWLMSDIHSEGRETNNILYGGNGLVTRDGIYKPAYFALYFLAQSKPYLVKRGTNYFVTADGHNGYTAIIHNMRKLNYYAFLKKEENLSLEDLDRVFDDERDLVFELHIKNTKPGTYRIKCYRLDQYHGDIIRLWTRNGFIQNFKPDELDYFKNINVPEMTMQIRDTNHSDTLVLTDTIEQNHFLCYKLELI